MHNANTYDVAIIGGGVGGLSLAALMARQGYRVAVFEKEQYPFHKVCGEYISMESWPFLERLGLPLSRMNLPQISKLHVSAPSGASIVHDLDPGGFGISRYLLDHKLAELARERGAEVFESCTVDDIRFANDRHEIKTSQGAFFARLCVGAYGKRGKPDFKLKRKFISQRTERARQYIAVKYHVEADLPHDAIGLHIFKNGYCGISQIEGGKYCLCYLSRASNLSDSGNSIERMQTDVLEKNPYLKSYFDNYPRLWGRPVTISQISFEKKALVEAHIMMLGDAAGLIAPLCGNGMSMAMRAAQILSVRADLFLNGNCSRTELERTYSTLWRREFNSRLATGRILQSLFGDPTMSDLLIHALRPFPGIVSQLVKLTHGKSF